MARLSCGTSTHRPRFTEMLIQRMKYKKAEAEAQAKAKVASAFELIAPIKPIDAEAGIEPPQISDPQDIVALLQAMHQDADLVTLYPPSNAGFLSGRIGELLLQTRRFVFEAVGPAPLPPDGPVLLVAKPQGIKLQFQAEGQWLVEPGQPLRYEAELPQHIVHLQRRRFPRLEAPLGPALRAELMHLGKIYVLSVDDLSLGGIGLRMPAHEGGGLIPGQTLRQVQLELGQAHPLVVNLELRSRRAFRSFLAGEQLHFGCRFVELDPADEAELQRIVNKFDADRRGRNTQP